MLTACTSGVPNGTSLDPTYPQTICVAEETLGFRLARISRAETLLMSAFSLLYLPANLTIHLHKVQNAPLP